MSLVGLSYSPPFWAPRAEPSVMIRSRDQHLREQRLRELVLGQGDFVTRSLRNLGVFGGELDDCVQKVFLVVARRLDEIEEGKERAFLFACAKNTAAHFRRSIARKKEVTDDELGDRTDPRAAPDGLVEQKRHRELLDQILETMEEGVRSVFVLYSFEEMTMAEIAIVLDVPSGTVASRLRRAREIFKKEIQDYRLCESQITNIEFNETEESA